MSKRPRGFAARDDRVSTLGLPAKACIDSHAHAFPLGRRVAIAGTQQPRRQNHQSSLRFQHLTRISGVYVSLGRRALRTSLVTRNWETDLEWYRSSRARQQPDTYV